VYPGFLASQQEPIVEIVDVVNVEIPVRVFQGKMPVKGLKKEDFKLFVNGKPRNINGFYPLIKKLDPAPPATAQPANEKNSRLFVLIFNFTDFRQDVEPLLDYFFNRVARAGDRLMVLTNHYFFPEWEINDIPKTRREVVKIVAKEAAKLKIDIQRWHSDLYAMGAMLKARLTDETEFWDTYYPSRIYRDFFLTYNILLEDIGYHFLALPTSQYIKIAEYLRARQGDKWVLNFFQVGQLPLPDNLGFLQKSLDAFITFGENFSDGEHDSIHLRELSYIIPYGSDLSGAGGGDGKGFSTRPSINFKAAANQLKRFQFDQIFKVTKAKDQLLSDIGKIFLNSGATFHTMLLRPVNPYFSENFRYQPVDTEAEIVLKKLARLTGGSIVQSNKISDFDKKIKHKEDIIYMLSYALNPSEARVSNVKVAPVNTAYRVVYDDRRRLKAFRAIKKKIDEEEPGLFIESLAYNKAGHTLTVKLKNIELVHYDGDDYGAVRARIKVKAKRAKTKNAANIEKTFKSIKPRGIFHAQLPVLSPGTYTVVLEVKDLFSLDNKFAGDAIKIKIN
jgi:hypothetical protein